jgi:hypothetical protein
MTAEIIKILLVMVMVVSLTGCLMGKNENPVFFLNACEELPTEGGYVTYEVHELPQSGMLIVFPKKPVEERGVKLSDVSFH